MRHRLQQPAALDRKILLHQRGGQLFAGDVEDGDAVVAQQFVGGGALGDVAGGGGGADGAADVVDGLVEGFVEVAFAQAWLRPPDAGAAGP